MSRRPDDLSDIPSIVPDTDARSTARVKPSPRPTTPRSSNSTAPSPASGLLRQGLLFLTITGLGAACAHFYLQGVKQAALNEQLSNRLVTIESQVGVANDASDQPTQGETLGSKVKSLETSLTAAQDEIRKLWGISNDKNRKQLESHDTRLAELQKNLDNIQSSLADTRKQLSNQEKLMADTSRAAKDSQATSASLAQSVAEMRTQIGNLQQRIAQGDPAAREASQQAALAQEQAEQLQAKLEELSRRVAEHDDNLRGIDTFRRSVNSDLNKLKGNAGNYAAPPSY